MTETEAMQRMQGVLRRQHKALSTEAGYLHWLSRYIGSQRHQRPFRMAPGRGHDQLSSMNRSIRDRQGY